MEGTSFIKNDGPDSLAVMVRISLNVENHGGGFRL
jgi:hypothetical protein